MRKKSILLLILVFSLSVSLVTAGCGKKGKDSNGGGQAITLAGSTSVQPLADELAEAYMHRYPDSKIFVQGGGSTAGVQAAGTGTANIGTSSRELKPEEKGLDVHVIAQDAIILVVHPNNPVKNLSMDEAQKIYTGKIKNWKEVGGNDEEIILVTREEGSGTRGAFEEIVLGEDVRMARALVQPSSGAVRQTVIVLENAIGYISLGTLNDKVKALQIDGVTPSEETVKEKKYKIARPFLFLTKGEVKGLSKDFINFVLGEAGQEIVAEEFISVH